MFKVPRIFLAIFSLLFIHFSAFTQQTPQKTGEIRGFVYDAQTGEPGIFLTVYLKGTTHAVATDINGYFSMTKIPVGNYTLMITAISYDTLKKDITVVADKIITEKLYVQQATVQLGKVDIETERMDVKEETKVSIINVTPKNIRAIPSVGGEADIAQYLQIIPGVVSTGDQGGQLYIRGGSPIQNKALLDGAIIYNPFHSIGLFSVFETDIIRNVDVYTGGFGAIYGGRISSVIDITTRDGNKNNFAGKLGVNPFTSKLLLEGPITKNKKGDTDNSFLFTSRVSYLDKTSDIFYKYVNDSTRLPYNFQDFFGKISLVGKKGGKLNFFGFSFNDQINFSFPSNYQWGSYGGGSSFVFLPPASSSMISGNLAYSTYKVGLSKATDAEKQAAENMPRESSIGGFNGGLNFTYFFGKNYFKYGFEVLGYHTYFLFTNAVGVRIEQDAYDTEGAAFLLYKWVKTRFVIEPSFRFQFYAENNTSPISLEPRLNAKFIFEKLRVKFAAGRYSQNVISATSDRDVVSLFQGFLFAPSEMYGQKLNHTLQIAHHYIGGFEFDVTKHSMLNIEGYIKIFDQLSNINRDKLFPRETGEPLTVQNADFVAEKGIAQGVDVLYTYQGKRLYLWGGYSYMVVTRDDGTRIYPPHFDRRHNMNLLGVYSLGKNKQWEVSARWNLGSGFPFTRTKGCFEKLMFDNLGSPWVAQNGTLNCLLEDDIYKGRLPWFHRLDFSAKRTWKFKRAELEANVSVINVYNRKNIFYVDRLRNSRAYQLPVLPSAGLNFSF